MGIGTVRRRFWVQTVCALVGTALFVLTLFSREWIEVAFGVDPDGGSGALELAISVGLLVAAVASAALARQEWRLAAARR